MNYSNYDVTVHYPGGRYETSTVHTFLTKKEVAERIANDLAESGICVIDGDVALVIFAAESISVTECLDEGPPFDLVGE